ncbi:hypothetical protein EGW08_013587, partial [Elysia chlorotica]
ASHNSTVTPTRSLDSEVPVDGEFSDLTIEYASIVLKMYVNVGLGLGGIVANLINCVIFYTMGLSDGVSQNFLILSVSDGVVAAAYMVNFISYILLHSVFTADSANLETLLKVFNWSMGLIYLCQTISYITTTVIAIVRCCCVTMPLRVKRVWTVRRQLVTIVVSSLCVNLVNVVCLSLMG